MIHLKVSTFGKLARSAGILALTAILLPVYSSTGSVSAATPHPSKHLRAKSTVHKHKAHAPLHFKSFRIVNTKFRQFTFKSGRTTLRSTSFHTFAQFKLMNMLPTSGAPGSNFQVWAGGFTPASTCSIAINGQVLQSGIVPSSGGMLGNVGVGNASAGDQLQVVLADSTGNSATGTFLVVADPNAKAGAPISPSGSGTPSALPSTPQAGSSSGGTPIAPLANPPMFLPIKGFPTLSPQQSPITAPVVGTVLPVSSTAPVITHTSTVVSDSPSAAIGSSVAMTITGFATGNLWYEYVLSNGVGDVMPMSMGTVTADPFQLQVIIPSYIKVGAPMSITFVEYDPTGTIVTGQIATIVLTASAATTAPATVIAMPIATATTSLPVAIATAIAGSATVIPVLATDTPAATIVAATNSPTPSVVPTKAPSAPVPTPAPLPTVSPCDPRTGCSAVIEVALPSCSFITNASACANVATTKVIIAKNSRLLQVSSFVREATHPAAFHGVALLARAGARFSLSMSGLSPNASVRLYMGSRVAGSATIAASGRVVIEVQVSRLAKHGAYTLTARESNGRQFNVGSLTIH